MDKDTGTSQVVAYLEKTATPIVEGFNDLKAKDVANLLSELKTEGKIRYEGTRPTGYWVLIQ